jgi:hypothetical protein
MPLVIQERIMVPTEGKRGRLGDSGWDAAHLVVALREDVDEGVGGAQELEGAAVEAGENWVAHGATLGPAFADHPLTYVCISTLSQPLLWPNILPPKCPQMP